MLTSNASTSPTRCRAIASCSPNEWHALATTESGSCPDRMAEHWQEFAMSCAWVIDGHSASTHPRNAVYTSKKRRLHIQDTPSHIQVRPLHFSRMFSRYLALCYLSIAFWVLSIYKWQTHDVAGDDLQMLIDGEC